MGKDNLLCTLKRALTKCSSHLEYQAVADSFQAKAVSRSSLTNCFPHWHSGEDLTKEKDGGIERSILTKGDGYQSPNKWASVHSKFFSRVSFLKIFSKCWRRTGKMSFAFFVTSVVIQQVSFCFFCQLSWLDVTKMRSLIKETSSLLLARVKIMESLKDLKLRW